MHSDRSTQMSTIIHNVHTQLWYVPFLSDLFSHTVFGPILSTLSSDEQKKVDWLLRTYVESIILGSKTKWWLYFKRFYETQKDLFWEFRRLQQKLKTDVDFDKTEFQSVWKIIEEEMFRYEWLLTQKMTNQAQWLNKTLDAFYDIVYWFFPYYNDIE